MIYTLKQYTEKFHPTKAVWTVRRMIKSGLMPENHNVVKAHDYFIEVKEDGK